MCVALRRGFIVTIINFKIKWNYITLRYSRQVLQPAASLRFATKIRYAHVGLSASQLPLRLLATLARYPWVNPKGATGECEGKAPEGPAPLTATRRITFMVKAALKAAGST